MNELEKTIAAIQGLSNIFPNTDKGKKGTYTETYYNPLRVPNDSTNENLWSVGEFDSNESLICDFGIQVTYETACKITEIVTEIYHEGYSDGQASCY
ncbi:hypothetical protein MHB54_00180 [Paenibacillus sp. FSL M7-0802]|uniref:hypothetical protein n=1 Tax=Paenibacillus sp. FSL M7-0802 TaxID=2921536 RepID=UPI0030F605E1